MDFISDVVNEMAFITPYLQKAGSIAGTVIVTGSKGACKVAAAAIIGGTIASVAVLALHRISNFPRWKEPDPPHKQCSFARKCFFDVRYTFQHAATICGILKLLQITHVVSFPIINTIYNHTVEWTWKAVLYAWK